MIVKNPKTKKTIETIIGIILIMILTLFVFYTGYFYEKNKRAKIVHVDFTEFKETESIEKHKYSFMSYELSNYIEKLCTELEIDSDLVVSILLVENPALDPNAEHKNQNGSWDLGLFQLNDAYIYSKFIPDYWDLDIEFNPYNIKHNTFLALHHIEYLTSTLKILDDIIAAYNAGVGAVMYDKIPDSTRKYVKAVKNNYSLLKDLKNE